MGILLGRGDVGTVLSVLGECHLGASYLRLSSQPIVEGEASKGKRGFFCLKKTRSTVVPLKWHMFGMF